MTNSKNRATITHRPVLGLAQAGAHSPTSRGKHDAAQNEMLFERETFFAKTYHQPRNYPQWLCISSKCEPHQQHTAQLQLPVWGPGQSSLSHTEQSQSLGFISCETSMRSHKTAGVGKDDLLPVLLSILLL